LLVAVPNSVLWLTATSVAAQRNLAREAELRGVARQRLVFAPYITSGEDHLARLALADLFLDTLPYNAHASACDALWAGVPVLSQSGNTFAGRVGASLLRACNLPELIVDSPASYEALALGLAREPSALSAIKGKLVRNRLSCALFDTTRFTRHLEAAYITMWERHGRGQQPESFSVPRMQI
jgi:protein O-GlcNAc transferase